ncbi:MAG: transposase [Anaerolineales bacterium]
MNLIAQVKLLTTPDQVSVLKRTLETANAACDYISDLAWEHHCFKRYELQKRFYQKIRQKFPDLSSQVVIRCIAKVTDAYKLDRKTKRAFRPQGSISYDQRILSWRTKQDEPVVSIWSLEGRLKILAAFGPCQKAMIEHGLRGAADLIYRDGAFYLHQVCEVEEPDPDDPEGWLGIDLGIVNLATTSDGDTFSGKELEARRQWYEKRRAILQSVGTRSAKRALMKLSGRFARFQKHVNHCISKALVGAAKRTSFGIALEDLSGIRKRVRVRRGQRTRHHNWAFHQLGQFVTYKARLAGVAVTLVDPRYTSQLCPLCGHISRSNRKSRDWFACSSCGFAAPADHVAAINIAARADVDRPMDSTEELKDIPMSIAAPFEVRVNAQQLAVG